MIRTDKEIDVVILPTYDFFFYVICRTKFFCLWFCYSAAYLLVIFECFVPLLELLPQENFAFITLIAITLFCFVKVSFGLLEESSIFYFCYLIQFQTYRKSELNLLNLTIENDDSVNLLLSDKEDVDLDDKNLCSTCKRHIPSRAQHCVICKTCILRRDHHSYLLNCCIGRFNHKYYLFGLFTALSTLILFANLCLTAICHPFEMFSNIFGMMVLLPDDCSDVYDVFE